MSDNLTFERLAAEIKFIHASAKTHAIGAVNRSMTLRNWLIGYYKENDVTLITDEHVKIINDKRRQEKQKQ